MQDVAKALENLQRNTQNPLLDRLGALFEAAGFELALVGGPVRDAILGRVAPDLDFTTSASPDEILKLLKPISSATWDIGRAFGTIAAQIGEEKVEITTYRADSYDSETRKPTVEFGTNLEDDLVRRDFTVNAMALRLPSRTFVDPHSGLRDLLFSTLKTPSKPEISFSDDPLRMMRAARFASQLGFEIEPETFEAMVSMRERISIISMERVRDELSKLLLSSNPRPGLEALVDSGIASIVLPELPALRLELDEHHHHKDVYQHTITVVEQAIDYEKDYGLSNDLVLRLAALLHDIGKPATRRLEPGGAVSFHHHDVVGAKLAKKRLQELRFDNDTIKAVAKLIELHLRFFGYSDQQWSDSAVRRYVRDAEDQLVRLHALTRADVTTRNRRKADRLAHAYDDLEQRIKILQEQEELDSLRPELDGAAIMELLGLKPGPEVGQAYKYLMEIRLDEGEIGRAEAEKRLLSWWQSR
ncbi:CCA tRNA nucleotidyltransferase [Aquiluna sp. KACHI24]|uniref:CCA tRNA nucleotidyltransferase n=1 Tax=Aquiluna sp. KACHI24 TaxID=2968831 RepID=UPI00220431AC|nr:CCA tRNA nucleotidyltransferase [Aquiluna sp. KACHI24]BDQ01046.1 CCA tRNA nucleotidyltransferase [Aquiluna sp. KACHI24]